MKVKATATGDFVGQDFIAIKLSDDEMHLVPARIDFEVDGLDWLISGVIEHDADATRNDLEAIPVITQLMIRQRPGGKPVSPTMLRGVKLAEVRDAAINQSTVPYERVGNKFRMVDDARFNTALGEQGTRAGDPSGRVAKLATAKQGRRPDRDDLVQAVAAYQAAQTEGRTDLLKAVGEACFVSTATAGRRIQAAKKAGLLEVDE